MRVAITANSADALVKVGGISMIERLLRTLQRRRILSVQIVGATGEVRAALSQPSWPRSQLQLEFVDSLPDRPELTLLLPGDMYCDDRLLVALLKCSKPTILIDSNPSPQLQSLLQTNVCGPRIVGAGSSETLDVATLDPYSNSLRREVHPLWFPAPAKPNVARAESLLFDSVQKGLLDLTAKLHWPFENFVVRLLWPTKITPNQVTCVALILGGVTTIEFARGHWWIAVIMSRIFAILDGVDGKLARTRVETTAAGKLESYADSAIEYSWWLGLSYSLGTAGLAHAWLYSLLIIVGDLLGRIANGLVAAHRGVPSHRYSEFERWFRLVGGRRDIYTAMLLVGLLVRQPGLAFAAAGYWGIITAAIQGLRGIYTHIFTPRVAV